MTVRRGLAVAATLAVVAGLGGCSSGDPEASPPISASPSPSEMVSASPSPTDAPSIPPEAQGTDEESAKAFVRYWFEVLNSAMNSGDVRALRALSADGCVTCEALATNIQDAFDDGGYVESRGWSVAETAQLSGGSTIKFDMLVNLGQETFYAADGEVLRRFDGEKGRRMVIALETHDGTWQVARLDVEA